MSDVEKGDCPEGFVSFIRDEPADEDFFQTHGRLAKAIASAIRWNPELRVIGLLGRWGSGKSTVVEHLKKELIAESPNGAGAVHMFTYDAWLHQSDPVRRSFLESLLSFLIEGGWTSREIWQEKLFELSGQVEKTDVSQTPVLTDDAKWIFISLLPVPLAIGLLDLDTIKDAWGSDKTAAGVFSFWLSLLLLAIPIVVVLFRYSINKEYQRHGMAEGASLLPILMNRSVERTRSTTRKSPEPSSIEFGAIFRELMCEATKAGDRFVFVIDNLDRVADTEALQMWATVRSFFLKSSEYDSKASSRSMPVVVLPVDTHALERMFASTSEQEDLAKELVHSFVNKTFDITFEVSEPVMSDWRAYLEKQMTKTFGERLKGTWVFWTRHFFEASLTSTKAKVTPREINKLINKIAALYVQWTTEEIQFEVLAYYAVYSASASSDLLKFLTNPANDIERVADNWRLQFAALHYGVAVEKAAQILIEEPLRDAIGKLDKNSFRELTLIPGFGDNFERVTTSDALNNTDNVPSFQLVTNAALLLNSVENQEGYWKRQSWDNLINKYFDCPLFDVIDSDLTARVSSFYQHLDGKEEKQAFVDGVAEDIAGALSSEPSDVTINILRDAAANLFQMCNREQLSSPMLAIECEPSETVRLLSKLWTPSVWQQLRTGHEATAVVDALAAKLQTPGEFALVPSIAMLLSNPTAANLFEPPEKPQLAPLVSVASQIVRQQNVAGAVPTAVKTLGVLRGCLENRL